MSIHFPPRKSPFTVTQDLIREWRRAAVEEVDFQLEAKNAMQAANALRRHSVDVTCPEPMLNLCSRRVLTMVFIEGWKITDLDRMPYGADREGLARNLVHAFALLVFQEGLIHGDPHPGVALEAFMRWNDNLHHFVLTGLFFCFKSSIFCIVQEMCLSSKYPVVMQSRCGLFCWIGDSLRHKREIA